jgi:hypothetical protein
VLLLLRLLHLLVLMRPACSLLATKVLLRCLAAALLLPMAAAAGAAVGAAVSLALCSLPRCC